MNIQYRPEIDGLRAVSVIAVILFHLGVSTTQGGFIGVDVFFTISGFLITSIVVQQQEKNCFRVLAFYQGRIKRLFPALFVVLSTTAILSWVYLLPDNLVAYAKSLFSSLFYGSNIWFYYEDAYHSVEALKKPLLHTWSLSVEEQFYFLFPLLFLGALKLKTQARMILCLLTLAISLLTAHFLSYESSKFNFYSTFSRAWEFMVGIGAYYYLKNHKRVDKYANLFSIIALAVLISFFVYFDADDSHPSLITLIPVCATGLILVKGENSYLIRMLLGSRLMSWIGRLSYSLYLWHFPIISFYLIKNNTNTIPFKSSLKILVLTFLLSVITYYFIENPLRHGNSKRTNFLVVVFGSILLIYSIAIIKNDGFKQRLGNVESIFEGTEYAKLALKKDGRNCYVDRQGNGCRFEGNLNRKRIISMGDSHAYTLNNPLKDLALRNGFSFEAINLTHCPYVLDTWRKTGFKAKCDGSKHEELRKYLLSIEPSIIINTVRFPMYLNPSPFNNEVGGTDHYVQFPFTLLPVANQNNENVSDLIVRSLTELALHGHTVIQLNPIPEVAWDLPKEVRSRLDAAPDSTLNSKIDAFKKLDLSTPYHVYKKRIEKTEAILSRLNHENIIRVFPDKVFCSEEINRCETHSDSILFYRDSNHLSTHGTKMLSEHIFNEANLSK